MIRTNYQKSDWQKFIPSISLRLFLMFGVLWVFLIWFVIPMALFITHVSESITHHPDLSERFIQNHYNNDDSKLGLLNMFLLGMVIFPVTAFLTTYFLITKMDDLGIYISKKLHIHPNMALCIIRNGKIVMRIRCD